MIRLPSLALALLLGVPAPTFAATDPLITISEQSGFVKTGRYDEVIDLCARFQKAYPAAVRCVQFGRSPEGRPMMALIASRTGALSAKQAHGGGCP